mmetsp:Transcript_5317/g.12256  ORF Transcript_5317/g.12256 Transcript_5317/m.12256 type:complete len:271 (-) Transcript_5317:286-1098(-)
MEGRAAIRAGHVVGRKVGGVAVVALARRVGEEARRFGVGEPLHRACGSAIAAERRFELAEWRNLVDGAVVLVVAAGAPRLDPFGARAARVWDDALLKALESVGEGLVERVLGEEGTLIIPVGEHEDRRRGRRLLQVGDSSRAARARAHHDEIKLAVEVEGRRRRRRRRRRRGARGVDDFADGSPIAWERECRLGHRLTHVLVKVLSALVQNLSAQRCTLRIRRAGMSPVRELPHVRFGAVFAGPAPKDGHAALIDAAVPSGQRGRRGRRR